MGNLFGMLIGTVFNGDFVGAQRNGVGTLMLSSPVSGTSCSIATISSLYFTGSGVNSSR